MDECFYGISSSLSNAHGIGSSGYQRIHSYGLIDVFQHQVIALLQGLLFLRHLNIDILRHIDNARFVGISRTIALTVFVHEQEVIVCTQRQGFRLQLCLYILRSLCVIHS